MSPATFRGWTASSVPIGLWIAHLTALAALTRVTCEHPGLTWLPHVLTIGLALACVPFLVMSFRLRRQTTLDDTETLDDLRLLSGLGLGLGGASLLLIVAEGSIVVGIGPCL